MFKFSFVILHYQVEKDTIECIESIINNIKYENYEIIVVDNNSPNLSGINISHRYKNNTKIHFILNDNNLGFARGNNVGYKYAKYDLKSDFIILINNDTIIKQEDFVDLIIKKYKLLKFHVLGPDVISIKDGGHQNPQRLKGISKGEIIKQVLIKERILLVLNVLKIDVYITNIVRIFKNNKTQKLNRDGYEKELINVQLNGCCLVFSPDYVKKYDGLYDKTFMYMEEDILYFLSKIDELTMLYTPDIKIFHKEDSATSEICITNAFKKRFYYKNRIKSSKELYKLMKNHQLMVERKDFM